MKTILFFLTAAASFSLAIVSSNSASADDGQALGSCSNFLPAVKAQLSLTGKDGEIFVNATKLPILGKGSFYFHHTTGNNFVTGNATIHLTHEGGSKYTASMITTMGTFDLGCTLNETLMETKVLVAERDSINGNGMAVADARDAKFIGSRSRNLLKTLPGELVRID